MSLHIVSDPFRTAANWVVSLLPETASDQLIALAVAGGVGLAFLAIIAPFMALGMYLDARDRRIAP